MVGKAAIGNMLGGIGYFYGQSKIQAPKMTQVIFHFSLTLKITEWNQTEIYKYLDGSKSLRLKGPGPNENRPEPEPNIQTHMPIKNKQIHRV